MEQTENARKQYKDDFKSLFHTSLNEIMYFIVMLQKNVTTESLRVEVLSAL